MKINFDTPPAAPDVSNDLAVRYAAARRNVPRWRWYLIVLAVLALPAYYGIRFVSDLLVVSAPGFVQMEQVTITAGAAGHVISILSRGTTVKNGEVLARIQSDSNNSRLSYPNRNKTPAAVIQAMQTAHRLQQKVVALRQNKVKAIHKLLVQGAATAADLAEAQEQLLAAESSAVQSRAALERLVAQLPTVLPTMAVSKAPFAGQVLRPLVYQGQWVAPDTGIVTLLSSRRPWIEAFLSPKDIRYARPGTPATIIFSDGWRIPAVVSSVSAEAGRLPPQYSEFFQARGNTLQVQLRLTKALRVQDMIRDMPLKVQFRFWPNL